MQANESMQMRVGNKARLTRVPGGQSISMQSSTWQHPWYSKAYWSPDQKQWIAVVRPGFVNGRAPVVRTSVGKMRSTPSFLAPVTAWAGAADIRQAAELASGEEYTGDPDTPIDVPLYRNPMIPLQWHEAAGIPAYFARRGVTANGRRRLVSSDLVLHQPRTALTSSIEIKPGLATGISNVTQTLGLRYVASDRLKVYSTPEFKPPGQTSPMDAISGLYEEDTWDELRIARIYLISPPDATGEPNANWLPFIRHDLFWNLCWKQPILQPVHTDPGVPFIPPLAGGAAQLVINFLTASINDMTNQALNILFSHSMAGTFWTPTGGGSDATFPKEDPATVVDKFGLAKDARSQARRAAVMASGALIDRLDPSFPFRAIPFSVSLLN